MERNRLEAFSDGVLAIVITIMVLELKIPHGSDWAALRGVTPVFLAYLLSFLYVGIYWNNHHHLIKACPRVNASIMWANLNLLFWLSLFPFATAWLGDHPFAPVPTAVYGAMLLLAALAYYVLQGAILALAGPKSELARSLGRDWKGKLSLVTYLAGMGLSPVAPAIASLLYVLIALLWLVPDRRIARVVRE